MDFFYQTMNCHCTTSDTNTKKKENIYIYDNRKSRSNLEYQSHFKHDFNLNIFVNHSDGGKLKKEKLKVRKLNSPYK